MMNPDGASKACNFVWTISCLEHKNMVLFALSYNYNMNMQDS